MPSLKPNQLLANVRAGRVEHCYSFGNHATPRYVDFICNSKLFETLWFDLEHFDIPTDQLAVLNLVARAHPVTTLARFHASNYQTVQRVLETGVGGIMCAMVESAEEAARIVSWAKFNNPSPAAGETTGLRGWNGGGIDARYGTIPATEYVSYQNRETAILCQVETELGLCKVDEIIATPGVDGIFFGPGDYAHRIGKLGQIGHPDVLAAMKRVDEACKQHGKFWGTLGIGPDHYQKVRALGAQLIGPGGDLRTLNLGLKELAKTFQGAPAS
ncbi:HpcH/HpaI aldolase family protein [Ereboglobus luteus]|uniref:Aldolase n=1 Tax=Ereboglobus luteus TaxID=1796921 RepID=A0A2U8E2U6_9BACT|nr:aldolase/citrate lyase family protein [Ereboglobus luteus]AWI08852.1 aldolase [Ereboglobus luteus]